MKKSQKLLLLSILLTVALLATLAFSACNENKIDYTVTVRMPDGSAAVGITVVLVKDGDCASATTDTDGIARLQAKAAKYQISLRDIPDGYGFYAEVSTDTLGTALSLTLDPEKVQYTATVKLANGQAVAEATVVWTSAQDSARATTDQQGFAKAMLLEGNYKITLENLPSGYYLETEVTATAKQPDVTVTLKEDFRLDYTVTVKTEGGLLYPNLTVTASSETTSETAKTDENGVAALKLLPDTYTIYINTPDGYWTEQFVYTVDRDNRDLSVTLFSQVITGSAPSGTEYTIGSIMYDFTFTTFDGKTVTLSQLLEEKQAVVLNFWYTTCSWCIKEFPVMWSAYQQYSDKLEIIAADAYYPDFCYDFANPEDNQAVQNATIREFRQYYEFDQYTFPMGMDEGYLGSGTGINAGFVKSIEGFPTTVIIDRYGAVAMIECGAILQEKTWLTLFETYTSENYLQNFVPGETETPEQETPRELPDVQMPDSALIEAAINNTQSGFTFSYLPETQTTDKEYSWPWIVSEKEGKKVIAPSNSGHDDSFATIHTSVTLKAGQVVAFDFLSSSETADALYIGVDGSILFAISGVHGEWETCYCYVAQFDGTYDLFLLYYKDSSDSDGDDAVYVTDMRICTIADIDVQTDLSCPAANGANDNGSYDHYITPVLGSDGFYRVNSADGAYLMVDIMHATKWSNTALLYYVYSEETNYYMLDLDGDGKPENCYDLWDNYAYMAAYSDYEGLLPMDEQCKQFIVALMDNILWQTEHRHLYENEWLEACKYIIRYGSDEEMPNPIAGMTEVTALEATEGKNTLTLHKYIFPTAGFVYKFVPNQSGVYQFNSVGNNETQIFLYDVRGIDEGLLGYCGDDILGRNEEDDMHNFVLYHYLEKGHTYYALVAYLTPDTLGSFDFYIEYKGDSYTVTECCTPGYHTAILDEDDNFVGIALDSVDVVLQDGLYYAVNDDGSLTPVLVDVTGLTHANPFMSLLQIIPSTYNYVQGFHPFDFSRDVMIDEDGYLICDEDGNVMLQDTDGVDYTARMLELCSAANEDGYIYATEELVYILSLYTQREQFGLDNDWLMFCRYQHTYCAPAEDNSEQ